MKNNKSLELLTDLKSQIENLPHRDSGKLDGLKQRTHMLTDKIFGIDSNYHSTLKLISFSPRFVMGGTGSGPYDNAWKRGVQSFLNLVNTMIEDISISSEMTGIDTVKTESKGNISPENIFLVHGHNEEMKQSVARTIEKLNLKPIILHERPNKGRTIIQKFIDHSNVGFAIVLMSGDDYGFTKTDNSSNAKLRARQNVILELGFFLGRLGIEKVVALFEQIENFEIPSDYDGVIFIPYDPDGRWKFDLIKELKASDYNVDANLII